MASACMSVSAKVSISLAFGSSSKRTMRITSSRLRKTISRPSRMCRRCSILPSRKRARRTSTSRRWSRKAQQRRLQPHHPRRCPAASSTFMLTGKRTSRSESRNRLSISSSGSTVRARAPAPGASSSARLVAHVAQQRRLLLDQAGELLDQLGLLHLIGDLGDDDPPGAAAGVLLRPAGAQCARRRGRSRRPRRIGCGARRSRRRWGSPGPGSSSISSAVVASGRSSRMQAGVDQLGGVVRRDRGRHADGDAGRAVGEQVREAGRQHDRLSSSPS